MVVELVADLENLTAEMIVAFEHVGHLLAGIHNGGVVAAAQRFADLRQ